MIAKNNNRLRPRCDKFSYTTRLQCYLVNGPGTYGPRLVDLRGNSLDFNLNSGTGKRSYDEQRRGRRIISHLVQANFLKVLENRRVGEETLNLITSSNDISAASRMIRRRSNITSTCSGGESGIEPSKR